MNNTHKLLSDKFENLHFSRAKLTDSKKQKIYLDLNSTIGHLKKNNNDFVFILYHQRRHLLNT